MGRHKFWTGDCLYLKRGVIMQIIAPRYTIIEDKAIDKL